MCGPSLLRPLELPAALLIISLDLLIGDRPIEERIVDALPQEGLDDMAVAPLTMREGLVHRAPARLGGEDLFVKEPPHERLKRLDCLPAGELRRSRGDRSLQRLEA